MTAQFVDPHQNDLFDPIHDLITFETKCASDVRNNTNGLCHMRRRLPVPNCEILLTYDTTANHANMYQGNDYMNIFFLYPSTLPSDLIKPMMENALVRHQYLLCQMRRRCNVHRIYVHHLANNYDEPVTTTRGMHSKYHANTYKIFAGRAGWWGVTSFSSNVQYYHPLNFTAGGFPLGDWPAIRPPEPNGAVVALLDA